MKERALLGVLFLSLCLTLAAAGCAPDGWPKEAAAPSAAEATASAEPGTPAPTEESTYYPPPPTPTPVRINPDTGYPLFRPTPEDGPLPDPTLTPRFFTTPTPPSIPTLPPTPVVTPHPMKAPPLIPEAGGRVPEPFSLVYRVDDTMRAVESDNLSERVLLDVGERHALHLATQVDGVFRWQQGGPSPDGRRLALVAGYSTYIFDVETGETKLLVENAVEPVWSPDGLRIAYRDATTGGLWVVDVLTGEARELYAADSPGGQWRYVTYIQWSPDGTRICFVDNQEDEIFALMLIDADEAQAQTLVQLGPYPITSPRWSPSGDRIAFTYGKGGFSPSGRHPTLFLVALDGSGLAELTRDMFAWAPAWSPDGRWIAFCGFAAFEGENQRWDVWLINPATDDLVRVTATADIGETGAVWSPSGLELAVVGDVERDSGQPAAWILDLVDGSTSEPISIGVDAQLFALQLHAPGGY